LILVTITAWLYQAKQNGAFYYFRVLRNGAKGRKAYCNTPMTDNAMKLFM